MEPDKKYYTVLDFYRIKRGWIQYNIKGENPQKERCVITRRRSKINRDRLEVKEFYILVIKPTSIDGEYRRVGVRLIQSNYVVRQRLNV